ncbi:MAG: hypothetical protein ABI837_03920 [Acidobacteriota bacterium]
MRAIRRMAVAVLPLLYAVLALVPWQPSGFLDDPDLSWQEMLHEAFRRGLHFGQDIVFTFGPWGFTYTGYHPWTFVLLLLVWISLALALALGAVALSRAHGTEPLKTCLFALAVIALASLQMSTLHDVPYLTLTILLLRLHYDGAPRWIVGVLAVATGFVSLVKFSFLVAAAAVVVTITLDEIAFLRRRPIVLPLYAGAIATFWILARQPLALFPLFVRRSLEVAAGYGEAMSEREGALDRSMLVSYCIVALLFLLLLVWGEWRRLAHRGLPVVAASAALLLLVGKAGFTRQESHDRVSFILLAILVLVSAPMLWQVAGRSRRWRAAVAAVLVVAVAMMSNALSLRGDGSAPQLFVTTLLSQFRDAVAFAREGRARPESERRSERRRVRVSLAARPPGQTFDVYPTSADLLSVWTLVGATRPMFQSYSAYTEGLLALNAEHLRGSSAPQTILFKIDPIDGRYPSLDDGLSWLELLGRYEPRGRSRSYLVLTRKSAGTAVRLEQIAHHDATFDESIMVPAARRVWARFHVRDTVAGRMARLFLGTPPLWCAVTVDDGTVRRYRMVPAIARAGFLVSPLVRTADDFESLYDERPGAARVVSIRFEGGSMPWLYQPRIAFDAYAMR